MCSSLWAIVTCGVRGAGMCSSLWAIVTCGVRGAGILLKCVITKSSRLSSHAACEVRVAAPMVPKFANSMGYRHMRRARCGGVAHKAIPPPEPPQLSMGYRHMRRARCGGVAHKAIPPPEPPQYCMSNTLFVPSCC